MQRTKTKFFLILSGLLVMIFATPLWAAENYQILVKDQDISKDIFYDNSGQELRLENFAGKVILINFWATWCGPCVAEMPHLNELQKRYKERGLEVITLSQDFGGLDAVLPFFSRKSLTSLTAYSDNGTGIFNRIGEGSLPLSLLVRRDGSLAYVTDGYIDWLDSEVTEKIEKLL